MPRPEGLVFGRPPGENVVLGAFLIVIGFSFAGLALFIAEPEICGLLNCAAAVFGGVFVWAGVLYIAKRREFVIVLAEHAIHIGPYHHQDWIAYNDITGIRRGVDGEVILDCANRVLGYTIPYVFSPNEANRFIEELKRRVNAVRSPDTPT